MDYFEVVQVRHSVRSYKPDPVEPEKLQRILECARLAPTAANRQAYKVVVVATEGNKEVLQHIYRNPWFVQAPYILCVCSVPGKSWVRSDKKNYSDVDAAIVMDHMVLAATALGLGTCWVAAFDVEATRTILKLDDAWEPIAFTPLGYPNDSTFKKVRKPLEEMVVYTGPDLGDYKMTAGKQFQIQKQQLKSSLGRVEVVRKIHKIISGN
ncbi:MAG: nitroreductase [Syntrophomonadaceae bacterium]|nr:nitroreductase [Syntrophomonadaceae bacterium]